MVQWQRELHKSTDLGYLEDNLQFAMAISILKLKKLVEIRKKEGELLI